MRAKTLRANLMLLLTALIWGSAFVAQSVGMEHVGPFTFISLRSMLGSLVLLPVIKVMGATGKREREIPGVNKTRTGSRRLWLSGVCCGLALFAGSITQQIGIQYTTVGKAGFITALYMVIVPVFGLFLKKKVPLFAWISVAIATAGMYLLCINEQFTIGRGDLLILLCALFFAVHIMVIDHFAPNVDGVKMSCIQFSVCGVLAGIPALILEAPEAAAILNASGPILYAGVLSCGVAYTLQVVAQKDAKAVTAALILSLESVFAAIAGWLILKEGFSARELIGCVLVFSAIILVQIPDIKKAREAGRVF